jgi:hypothetical protein
MTGLLETQRDAIHQLARECARDAQTGRPWSRVSFVGEVDPKYFARLKALLGRPNSELEGAAFRRAFKLGFTSHEDGRGRDV